MGYLVVAFRRKPPQLFNLAEEEEDGLINWANEIQSD